MNVRACLCVVCERGWRHACACACCHHSSFPLSRFARVFALNLYVCLCSRWVRSNSPRGVRAQAPALMRAILTEDTLTAALSRPPALVDLLGPDGALLLPAYPLRAHESVRDVLRVLTAGAGMVPTTARGTPWAVFEELSVPDAGPAGAARCGWAGDDGGVVPVRWPLAADGACALVLLSLSPSPVLSLRAVGLRTPLPLLEAAEWAALAGQAVADVREGVVDWPAGGGGGAGAVDATAVASAIVTAVAMAAERPGGGGGGGHGSLEAAAAPEGPVLRSLRVPTGGGVDVLVGVRLRALLARSAVGDSSSGGGGGGGSGAHVEVGVAEFEGLLRTLAGQPRFGAHVLPVAVHTPSGGDGGAPRRALLIVSAVTVRVVLALAGDDGGGGAGSGGGGGVCSWPLGGCTATALSEFALAIDDAAVHAARVCVCVMLCARVPCVCAPRARVCAY
jgi:hypothetical protein